jgi:hypothetical protein
MIERQDGDGLTIDGLKVAIQAICATGTLLTGTYAMSQTVSAQTTPQTAAQTTAQSTSSQTVVAQNAAGAAGPNSDALEEVVVTAERRNTSEQTTPISMEALSGAQIAEKNLITITDIQQAVPSMTVNNAGLFQSINIRGIGNSVINPSIATGVAVMRDGHFQPETIGLSLPFYDIADVEVLRGPQGTYIGASSTGGAVLINSANPNLNGLSGYAETLFGDYNDKKVTGAINLPINDTMAARIAFNYERRNSFYKDIGADYDPQPGKPFNDPGQLDNQNIRISYIWKPTDNFQALLKFEFNYSNTDGTPDQPNQNVYLNPVTGTYLHSPYYAYSTHSPFTLNYDTDDRADVEQNNIYGLELKYTLPGDIVLRSMTGFQHNDVYQTVDVDATCAATCVPVALQGEYPGIYTHHTIGPNNNYKSQEFNLTSSADQAFTWIVGGWYFYRDTPVELNQYNTGYPNLTNPATAPEGVTGQVQQIVTIGATERTSGIFADGKYKITPQWEVELGVRGNHDDNTNYGAIEVNLPAVAGGGQLYIPNTGKARRQLHADRESVPLRVRGAGLQGGRHQQCRDAELRSRTRHGLRGRLEEQAVRRPFDHRHRRLLDELSGAAAAGHPSRYADGSGGDHQSRRFEDQGHRGHDSSARSGLHRGAGSRLRQVHARRHRRHRHLRVGTERRQPRQAMSARRHHGLLQLHALHSRLERRAESVCTGIHRGLDRRLCNSGRRAHTATEVEFPAHGQAVRVHFPEGQLLLDGFTGLAQRILELGVQSLAGAAVLQQSDRPALRQRL